MTIRYSDPRADELRDWLNARHKSYAIRPVTDAQLGAWLDDAETSEGVVEIRSHESMSGTTESYRIDVSDQAIEADEE